MKLNEIKAYLEWQKDMGVSFSMSEDEEKQDWLDDNKKDNAKYNGVKQKIMQYSAVENNSNKAQKMKKDNEEQEEETRDLADKAKNLAELRQIVENYKDLLICQTATKTVFADGNSNAKIMLIGEAPGKNEDLQGIPFCGESGQLLDRALSFIGLSRKENLYISNSVFWRPPANRTPTPKENNTCLPFVEKHIALINPKILLFCGANATKTLLNNTEGITKIHGKKQIYKNRYMQNSVEAYAIYHPSFLLRQPMKKKELWIDLLRIFEKNI